jgi:tetratricopeptide (TPR) repeat protein
MKLPNSDAAKPQQSRLLASLHRLSLLVPEAWLLLASLSAFAVWPITLLAIVIVLLVLSILVRFGALHMARAALYRGSLIDAEAFLRVARILNPYSPDTLALEGVLALSEHEAERAVSALQQAIQLQPLNAAYYAALSGALLELQQAEEAAQAARKALECDPKMAIAYLHLAQAEQALDAPTYQIEGYLRSGLATQPPPATEAVMRCVLAAHLLSEQRVAEANLTIHGAEALLPKCPIPSQALLRLHLGEVLALQGQLERAQEYRQSALAFDTHGRYIST